MSASCAGTVGDFVVRFFGGGRRLGGGGGVGLEGVYRLLGLKGLGF